MPKCPTCSKEIDTLTMVSSPVTEFCTIYLINGEIEYGDNDCDHATAEDTFFCPECNKPLFYKEAEAIAFLKGEPIPAE